jgi:small subunit ribosomal protein MRP21
MSASTVENARPPPTPYEGRSVAVAAGGFVSSYANLRNIMARNRVQYELRLSERHEKKGYKRRRLASERWRRVFASEVRFNIWQSVSLALDI